MSRARSRIAKMIRQRDNLLIYLMEQAKRPNGNDPGQVTTTARRAGR